jgi:hypothetical protein
LRSARALSQKRRTSSRKEESNQKPIPPRNSPKGATTKMDPATQAVVKQLLEENTATKAEAKVARQIAKELKDQQVLKEVRGQGKRAAQPPGSFSRIIPDNKFYCPGV